MSAFDALEAALSGAVSDTFADRARLLPRLPGKYAHSTADTARDETNVCGVYSAAVETHRAMAEKVGPAMLIAALRAEFWIEAANVPNDPPQKDDALSFPDLAGSPVYRIIQIDPTDRGDLNCILVIEDQTI